CPGLPIVRELHLDGHSDRLRGCHTSSRNIAQDIHFRAGGATKCLGQLPPEHLNLAVGGNGEVTEVAPHCNTKFVGYTLLVLRRRNPPVWLVPQIIELRRAVMLQSVLEIADRSDNSIEGITA